MELCIEHARERHNRSVERLADLMGLANKYTLYKWVESGKLPSISIHAFEHACGCDFITRYLAHSAAKLLIEIPVGRDAGAEDMQLLTGVCNDAVGVLIRFYRGEADAAAAIAATNEAMEALGWHRANAAKVQSPELDFGK